MADDWEPLLLDIVGGMSATWTCAGCGETFPNGPTDPAPFAFLHERIPRDPRGGHRIIGEICKVCHDQGLAITKA